MIASSTTKPIANTRPNSESVLMVKPGSFHLRLRPYIVLRRVVKILLRDGLLLRQRCIPIDVELRSALIGFRYRNLRLR